MANKIISTYKPISEGTVAKMETASGLSFPAAWKEFLQTYNVGVPAHRDYQRNGLDFTIQHFLGASKTNFEDLGYVMDFYSGRIPEEYIPVAIVQGGNLLCMDTSSGFLYYWDHEVHDTGANDDDAEPLNMVAGSLEDFIDELVTVTDEPQLKQEDIISVKKSDDFDELFKAYKK